MSDFGFYLDNSGLVSGGTSYPLHTPIPMRIDHGTGYYAPTNSYYGNYHKLFNFTSSGSQGVVFDLYLKGDVNYSNKNISIKGYVGQWSASPGNYNWHISTAPNNDATCYFATDSSRNVYFWTNLQWECYASITIYRYWGAASFPISNYSYNNNADGRTWHVLSSGSITREAAWGT